MYVLHFILCHMTPGGYRSHDGTICHMTPEDLTITCSTTYRNRVRGGLDPPLMMSLSGT